MKKLNETGPNYLARFHAHPKCSGHPGSETLSSSFSEGVVKNLLYFVSLSMASFRSGR